MSSSSSSSSFSSFSSSTTSPVSSVSLPTTKSLVVGMRALSTTDESKTHKSSKSGTPPTSGSPPTASLTKPAKGTTVASGPSLHSLRQTPARYRRQQEILRLRIDRFRSLMLPLLRPSWLNPILQAAKSDGGRGRSAERFGREGPALQAWLLRVHARIWKMPMAEYIEALHCIRLAAIKSTPVPVWSFWDTYRDNLEAVWNLEFQNPLLDAIVVLYESRQQRAPPLSLATTALPSSTSSSAAGVESLAETTKPIRHSTLQRDLYDDCVEWLDTTRDAVVNAVFGDLDAADLQVHAPVHLSVPQCPLCRAKARPIFADAVRRRCDEGASSLWVCSNSECQHEWTVNQ